MAEYRRIEYRIGPNGEVTETVLDATGPTCIQATQDLEVALGEVIEQEYLPEFYDEDDHQNDLSKNADILKVKS